MNSKRLAKLGAHGVDRVERGKGILEDDAEFRAGEFEPLLRAEGSQVGTAQHNGAPRDVGDRVEQPGDGLGRHRLATAGLAEQCQGTAGASLETDIVDGPQHSLGSADVDVEPGHGENNLVLGELVARRGRSRGRGVGSHYRTSFARMRMIIRLRGSVRRQRWAGSVAMRSHAASTLAATVVTTMASPGKKDSHHAIC